MAALPAQTRRASQAITGALLALFPTLSKVALRAACNKILPACLRQQVILRTRPTCFCRLLQVESPCTALALTGLVWVTLFTVGGWTPETIQTRRCRV